MIINALTMLFILRISRTIFSPYLALFVENRVAPESVSLITGLLTGLVGISTAAASMNIGKLTNRFNKFIMLRILIVLGIVTMTALTQYKTISLALGINELLVFSIIYMLFFFVVGGIEPIISSTAAMAVEPSDRGALFGLQGMVGSMAWAVAPMIAGPIVYFQPVEKVLYVVPVVLLISFVVAGIFIKNQEHEIEETYETP
jgi:DHA1 family multidrug resistance protein-like MFS transporter